MAALYSKQRYLLTLLFIIVQLNTSVYICAHTPLLMYYCTSLSAVFRLFLTENNFHHCGHRKIAMRHTLPNIQISLSRRKFSMMKTVIFRSVLSTCTGCVSYFCHSAPCGEGLSDGGQNIADMEQDGGPWSWKTGSWSSVAVHWMLGLLLTTDSDRRAGLCCQVTCPPSQPFTLHPASSLPPTPGPKRRGRAVCAMRRWQVVLCSGSRRCVQSQMPAASAGMVVCP